MRGSFSILIVIFGLAVIALGIWVLAKVLGWLGRYILKPIKDTTERVTLPAQFSIFDFVSLLILLQFALGYALRFNEGGTRAFFPQLVLYFMLAGTAIWLSGVSLLSRAGIRQPLRRGMFVVVLLPGIVVVLAGQMLVPGAWFYWYNETDNAELLIATVSGSNLLPEYVLIFSSVGMIVGPFALNRLARWIVAPTLQEMDGNEEIAPLEQKPVMASPTETS